MKQRIILEEDLTMDELQNKISNGARFIIFQYCISILFAVSLRRFSPAILIEDSAILSRRQRKYNILSLIFGWWGIPWGPIYTVKSINLNKKGGLDITDDILLNVTQDGLNKREIELKITNTLFCKPDKWDIKAFKKALVKKFERDYNVKNIVVGLFINTEEDEAPHYTIGLNIEKAYDKYKSLVTDSLYTQFRKYTYFEFVDLKEEDDIFRLLEKQGETIIKR